MAHVSVVIPTFNGVLKIGYLLDALKSQSHKPDEVVVVIDGSWDNTEQMLRADESKTLNLSIHVIKNSGRAAARNMGVKSATGELLIFCDDDMLPHPDSIAKHVNFHANNPDSVLGGSQFEMDAKSNADIQNYKAHLSQKWLSKYADGVSSLNTSNLFFTSANCSLPKKVFEQLGGFDEKLTDGEDYDLAYRALKNNIPVYFDKDNRSIHGDLITCISYIKRVRQYAVAKQHWGKIHGISATKRSRFVANKFFYRLFAFRYWAQAVDRDFFLCIPKAIRYKLYDVIIQALAVEFPKTKLE